MLRCRNATRSLFTCEYAAKVSLMDSQEKVFLEVDHDLRRIASEGVAYLPPCPYGAKCYRKNAQHFREYRHSEMAANPEIATNSNAEKESQQQQKKTPKKGILPVTSKGSSTKGIKSKHC